ncbi:TolC family protein [uncultured Planktosalinus sp.]|mgnify:FL=1|uniref:TolC family protein n=1 Tax=uncultured Planktosalinus sp. TaxID=1810935 RepID=UPI0030D9F7D2
MKKSFVFILLLTGTVAWSQTTITLEECYALAEEYYPLQKQTALLNTKTSLEREALHAKRLPQMELDAQATYQSDATEIPFPGSGVEPLNKDQYRATLTLNQLIYDGGQVAAASNLKEAELKTQQKQLEVSLYQLKLQINQIYFSILLNQQKQAVLNLQKNDLESRLNEVKSGIKHGLVLPASDKVIEAELLKVDQKLLEHSNHKRALLTNLSELIGQPLPESAQLKEPLQTVSLEKPLQRPELELFQLQKQQIEQSEQLLSKKNYPKLQAFATGGYGNPGLNMLENSFEAYYITGLRLNWKLFDWNANKKERKALSVNKEIIDSELEVFSLQTQIQLQQLAAEINSITDYLVTDSEIIKLRKEVAKVAQSQLNNGVITASAYLTELTALYEAEISSKLHRIQLQLAKANYNIIQGQQL